MTDFFSGSPFTVEIERDLSLQQQFLDVLILRKHPGPITLQLPDGMDGLAEHNLITFKSHRETFDAWAMKELIGHDVAYRKLVSPSPSDLLPPDRFRLFVVCSRFPNNLSKQIPWKQQLPGVYDCIWGIDTVRVIVAGQLQRERRNAPLHLFSASPELVGFGQGAYRRRSDMTSNVLRQLYLRFQREDMLMPYTMEDFKHWFVKDNFAYLTPDEQQEVLQSLPPEKRLAGLSPEKRLAGLSVEQIQRYLNELKAHRPSPQRKPKRQK